MTGNKTILGGILTICLVVGILGASYTGAFFADTETSADNIFVAGDIDLTVDHTKQTYRDIDCKTCSVILKSDTTNIVTGTDDGADSVPFPHNAVEVSNPNSAWTVTNDINATWIWATNSTLPADTTHDVNYTFEKTFEWWGPVNGITLDLSVGADNGYEIKLNGHIIGTDWTEQNYKSPADTYSGFGSYLEQGQNTLEITVENKGMNNGNPTTNPAGLLYQLVINGECGDNYFKTHCRLWGEKDLEDGDTFFNFEDVKPGDYGRNVISLHVESNDAWACLFIHNKTDYENDLIDSEAEAGDTSTSIGELSQYFEVFGWTDNNKNGLYEPSEGESELFNSLLADDFVSLGVADSNTGTVILNGITEYVGLYWCAGTITETSGTLSCDGSGMNNKAQTDSLVADLTVYAVQERNNGNFDCSSITEMP